MDLADLQTPVYFILNRAVDEERIPVVLDALDFAPPVCVIVLRKEDATLALKFSRDVVEANSFEHARSLALSIQADAQRPVLILAEAQDLTAVMSDGSERKVFAC